MYTVISAASKRALINKVNKTMRAHGYMPVGGVFVIHHAINSFVYFQAMIKPSPKRG